MRGNPLIINSDDILINKPNAQEMELEDLIYLPAGQQPPVNLISGQPVQQEPEFEITHYWPWMSLPQWTPAMPQFPKLTTLRENLGWSCRGGLRQYLR